MVMVLPMYEIEQAGLYYNTAAVIDADGTLPRQVPQAAHPAGRRASGRSSTSAPATAATRCSTPPSARSACTSATTATSPRAGGRSGSTAPRSCSTRRPPAGACREYIWRVEQPAAAVANMYYVGAINRVGIEPLGDNDFYGQSYFVDPEGKFVGDVGDAVQARADRPRPRHGQDQARARPLGVLPRPPSRRLRRAGGGADMATTLITERHGRLAQRASAPPTCSSTARPSPPCSRPGRPTALGITADRDDRRHRQVRHPRRRRRAHPHGAALRRHRGVRHVRDRHDRRGVGRRHHDRRLRRADAGESVHDGLAEWHRKADGNCAIDYGFHQIIGGVDDESLKAMTVPRRQRGHHQLQAVHGLPRGVLLRRRPDPAGDAERRRVRGDDHDARRERHRHRRARRAGARPRRDRPEVPLAHPPRRARGRGHPPGDPARQGRRQRAALHRAHVGVGGARGGRRGAARRPQRVRRDLPAVPLPDARGPARPARLRGRQVGVLDAAALEARAPPRPTSGRACA